MGKELRSRSGVSEFLLQDGQTFLAFGDSITQGHKDAYPPLGDGYVHLFSENVTNRFPGRRISYVNAGVDGDTVVDLLNRWQTDVAAQKPDLLSIMVGINDLRSHLRGETGAVGPDRFQESYDQLLRITCREMNCQVVLMTPFYLSTDRSSGSFHSQVLDLLPTYIAIVEEMSKLHGTRFLDIQSVFQELLQFKEPGEFSPEPVHPFPAGHLVIANSLFDLLYPG